MNEFKKAYIECLLWASDYDGPEGYNDKSLRDLDFDENDFAPEALETIEKDCKDFLDKADEMVSCDYEQAGYDFWLNRNGHGAGFWDGDWPENGDTLSDISHSFGEQHAYVGDDGLIYLYPG